MTLPDTRHSLLLRLQDADDHDAWHEFTRIYEPAVYRFGRKKGLQHADAAELAQDVLVRVMQAVPSWNQQPTRGSFRAWLFTVARHRILDAWRAAARSAARFDRSVPLENLADASDGREVEGLSGELRRQVIRVAAEQIRGEFHDSTWAAFWQTAIEGKAIAETAAALKMSRGAVYAARSRALARLRECVLRLWEECDQEFPS